MANKRKSKRQQVRYTAWLLLADGQLHGCVLSNASEHGACIELEDAAITPDRFTLLLSNNGTPQRKCRVVWRQPTQVGVTFELQASRAGKGSVVPIIEPDGSIRLVPAEA